MADENENEEEDYFESPIELIKEIGNHAHMEKAHKALEQSLVEIQERLVGELFEKEEELKRISRDRESLGIQLYNLQQQLARVQISLENSHNEYNALVDARLQEEELQKDIMKSNTDKQALYAEYSKQYKRYTLEIESLYETIHQVEKYNEEVKSEITVTRRAAYKTEQSMQQLEKNKESQDQYVDNFNKQITQLQEQITLYMSQYESQKKETLEANSVLQDTAQELDLIATEKKQLMVQWKASLSGLSRRDEALAQASQTLALAESAVHDYDVEIEAARRDIQKEQARHESLVNLRDRLENELHWVEDNLTKIRQEHDQLQERFTLLSKSLTQSDAEAKKLDVVAKQLGTDAESLVQSLQVVTQERQKLEEELLLIQSTHANVNKAVANLSKEQGKVLKKIHERENESAEIENEIARSTVDKLNAGALNDQLREQHATVSQELREKEALINKYQLEIRQRNDEVEKKMYRVDRLNKKFEKMAEAAGGEENLGPLENTIRNLNKEADAILSECKELEREWLKRQTELVTIASEADIIQDKNHELQARVTIFTQQQLRLTRDLRALKADVKGATQTNLDLQKDVTKLNALINSNHDQEDHLQHANFILERSCIEDLKEMERECVTVQATINESKLAKASVLDEIMDMERQALLWEKKIQLDKETRQALDPTVGQAETQTMEKEIHRMSLRLEALKREQERLATEMERAIFKRTSIQNRYKGKSQQSVNANLSAAKPTGLQDLTVATVKKRIGNLKKDARLLAEESSQYTSAIEERKVQLRDMTVELEEVTMSYGEAEEKSHYIQGEINNLLYQKQLNQERIGYRQKYSKRLKELAHVGVELTQSLQIERRLLAATQALENVREIVSDLQMEHPHLAEVLQRVGAMTDPCISVDDDPYEMNDNSVEQL